MSTIRHVSECLTSEFGIRTHCAAVPAKAHLLYLKLVYWFATIIVDPENRLLIILKNQTFIIEKSMITQFQIQCNRLTCIIINIGSDIEYMTN